jgi:hypothetical protein
MDIMLAILSLVSVTALCWIWLAFIGGGKKSSPPSPPPQKVSNPAQQRGELKRIAALQAIHADKRAKSVVRVDGLTWDDWMHHAILALQKLWPGYSYDQARKMIIEYLDDVRFGDPDYEWSVHAAHGIARQIVGEYGESYGANQ